MRPNLLISALLGFSLSLPAAHAAEQAPAATQKPAIEALSLATLSATVTAVDHETREVTLQDADGKETTLRVGEEVRNLPQVEVGDQLDIAYYELVDVEVLAPDEAEPRTAAISTLETAEPGQKPAGQLTTGVSMVATIEKINKAAETVTLRGLGGDTRTVKVRETANLDNIAVGDRVLISLTQAIAVEVTEKATGE
ncbi:MAG: hypothetical protein PVI91_00035 [Gammaproteobacteria bacterium]|jgi:hypothetical protein